MKNLRLDVTLKGGHAEVVGDDALAGFPALHFFGAAIFLMTYHLLSGWAAAKVRARTQEAVRDPEARPLRGGPGDRSAG